MEYPYGRVPSPSLTSPPAHWLEEGAERALALCKHCSAAAKARSTALGTNAEQGTTQEAVNKVNSNPDRSSALLCHRIIPDA